MPKKSLTAASVESLRAPKSGQVEYFDKGYPGLSLRVSYGGRKAWNAHYRLHGKLHRIGLGIYPAMTLAEAREAWRGLRKDVAAGIDPGRTSGTVAPATAFAAVAEEWLQRDQADNKSALAVRRLVERELIPAWGNRPIAEIGRRDVRDLIDSIVDRGAVIMARRVQTRLHRLFTWAVGRDIIAHNPVTGLPMPGSEIKRDRTLADDELVEVWNAAEILGYPFGSAVQLLVLTGARREEIGQLRWDEIEGDAIKLKGDRTKNGEPHLIPLSAAGRALLDSLPRLAGSDYVFTVNGHKHITAWSRAKDKIDAAAKIPEWRLHDFRRVVATGLQRLDVSLQTIETVLGHVGGSRSGVVGIYQRHSFQPEAKAALEAWGAHVMALIAGRTVGKVLPLTRSA